MKAFHINRLFNPIVLSTFLMFSLSNCKKAGNSSSKSEIELEKQHNKCIERIITKDSVLGSVRNTATKSLTLTETITNYTKALEELDFTDCPEQFTTAFKSHIEAWKNMKTLTVSHDTLRGEMHEVFKEIETSADSVIFKTLLKDIWDTWDLVEDLKK